MTSRLPPTTMSAGPPRLMMPKDGATTVDVIQPHSILEFDSDLDESFTVAIPSDELPVTMEAIEQAIAALGPMPEAVDRGRAIIAFEAMFASYVFGAAAVQPTGPAYTHIFTRAEPYSREPPPERDYGIRIVIDDRPLPSLAADLELRAARAHAAGEQIPDDVRCHLERETGALLERAWR